MRLLKMELYKIAAKPVPNIGLALIVGFIVLVIMLEVAATTTEIDGKTYTGLEAIQAERRLAKEYEGVLTMEKAEDIIERFGFSGYQVNTTYTREGNFCNQFITDKLTDFMQTGEKPVDFVKGEQWENYAKYYVDGSVVFGYTAGWEYILEWMMTAAIMLDVWLILMIAPVFSEEYSRNTAAILLPTRHGKSKDIRAKIAAALSFGVLIYLGVILLLFGIGVGIYGTDGLNAGASLIKGVFWTLNLHNCNVAECLIISVLLGLVAVIMNICMVLFVSSRCKSMVFSVIIGVLLYFLPFFFNDVLFQMLLYMGVANYFWGWILMDIMRVTSISMPFYLPWLGDFGIPANWLVFIPFIVIFTMVFSICCAYRSYQRATA